MSTLTKTLVVLLTLSAIFLCGIVVTYVTNADNYKSLLVEQRRKSQIAVTEQKAAQEQLRKKKEEFQRREDELTANIASLGQRIGNLENELRTVKRDKEALDEQVKSWVSIVNELTAANEKQGALLTATLADLEQIKAQQIKQHRELAETTEELVAKIAVVQTLDTQKKRLEEENAGLQNQMDTFLRKNGREVASIEPVTPERTRVLPVSPIPEKIGLSGTILAIDERYSIAQISIGSAHGVKEGMRFFVTRGDQFLCELLIIDVEPEKAAGVLERIRQGYKPRAGDNITTNL